MAANTLSRRIRSTVMTYYSPWKTFTKTQLGISGWHGNRCSHCDPCSLAIILGPGTLELAPCWMEIAKISSERL
jgi:hypothetical protein